MTHTKGPWKAAPDTADTLAGRSVIAWNVYESSGQKICGHVASVGALGMLPEEIESSASLMAAAPELLEALELFKKYEGSGDNEGLRMLSIAQLKATSAIKKARGE